MTTTPYIENCKTAVSYVTCRFPVSNITMSDHQQITDWYTNCTLTGTDGWWQDCVLQCWYMP